MAKKSKGLGGTHAPASTKGMSQKLGTPMGGSATGMAVGSKLEGAAALPYKGHNQGSGVRNGAHGLLAGTGGSKAASIPNGSGKLGRKSSQ